MASKINVNGFFRDTSGLPRMEELRKSHLANAPADPDTNGCIRKTCGSKSFPLLNPPTIPAFIDWFQWMDIFPSSNAANT